MNKTIEPALIYDGQTLDGATRNGHAIPVYDDGYGPLFIHRDSSGISGIVRASTWEDAYSICEDEFLPSADEEAGAEMERIDSLPEGDEKDHAQACFDEAYGYRGNTRREEDGSLSSIYAKDLNGDFLDLLTPELVADLELVLAIGGEPDFIEDARHEGKSHGDGFAENNVPSDTFESFEDAQEAHRQACFEAEENSRQYSPFESIAHRFNSLPEPWADVAWEAFDEAWHEAIEKDLTYYRAENYTLTGAEETEEE